MKKIIDKRWIQFIIAVCICIIIYKCINNLKDVREFISYVWDVLFPCTLGAILALFLNRPIMKTQRLIEKSKISFVKKRALAISIIIIFLILIAFVTMVINFIVPPLYKNIQELGKNLPSYYEEVKDFLETNSIAQKFYSIDSVNEAIQKLFKFDNLTKYIGVISGVANSFLTCFIGIILSIYLILEKNSILSFFKLLRRKVFYGERSLVCITYIKKSLDLFYSYFIGLFIDALVMGTICSILFSILKIPYAFILGLIVAIGNLVPFFGPIVSTAVVFIISAVTLGPVSAVWLLIFQFVLAQLDANLMQPKILSQSTGISPLLVLVSVTVFGSFWGPPGMIVGVPVCAIIKMIVVDYLDDGVINGK